MKRQKKYLWILTVLLFLFSGACVLVAGVFAVSALPYQDATPALAEEYQKQLAANDASFLAALIVALISFCSSAILCIGLCTHTIIQRYR